MKRPENRNMLWARVWADELGRLDLAGVVLSPGSRSTPLAVAFAEQKALPHYVILDERSAAFFALGMAQATAKPAVLVCTSGTAAANYLPAIVEANQAQIPLLVLTADRPVELRDSGANQTIDQVKLYGDQVRWYVDAGRPERTPAAPTLRALRTLANRAVARSRGPIPGPVHVNFSFDKPLEPVLVPEDLPEAYWDAYAEPIRGREDGRPFVEISGGMAAPADSVNEMLAERIQTAERGWIVCGPRCPGAGFPEAVLALAVRLGWPVFADALSGVRFHPAIAENPADLVLGGYEVYLCGVSEVPAPDLVLQFGAAPVSTALLNRLAGFQGAERVLIGGYGDWGDDAHTLCQKIECDPARACIELMAHLPQPLPEVSGWMQVWASLEAGVRAAQAQVVAAATFEGGRVQELGATLGRRTNLFVASSLPIRHVDEFLGPHAGHWRMFANRGASGIDGTLSSALGVAAALDEPVVVLLGDLALLHDLNALMLIRTLGLNVKVLVINNDGGGIFQRLPIAAFEPVFTQLFATPHGLKFKHAAYQFDLPYVYIGSEDALAPGLAEPGPALIEIEGDAVAHEAARARIRALFEQQRLGNQQPQIN